MNLHSLSNDCDGRNPRRSRTTCLVMSEHEHEFIGLLCRQQAGIQIFHNEQTVFCIECPILLDKVPGPRTIPHSSCHQQPLRQQAKSLRANELDPFGPNRQFLMDLHDLSGSKLLDIPGMFYAEKHGHYYRARSIDRPSPLSISLKAGG